MDKENRKKLAGNYVSRRKTGGVFKIENTETGSFITDCAADLPAAVNKFNFGALTNLCTYNALQSEWKQYGAGAFKLTVLEEITQGEDQSDSDFVNDVSALLELYIS